MRGTFTRAARAGSGSALASTWQYSQLSAPGVTSERPDRSAENIAAAVLSAVMDLRTNIHSILKVCAIYRKKRILKYEAELKKNTIEVRMEGRTNMPGSRRTNGSDTIPSR